MNGLLNIKDEVVNQRYGLKYIDIKDKEKLDAQLKKLRDNKILDKHNITYTYTEYANYIALVLLKPIDVFSKN